MPGRQNLFKAGAAQFRLNQRIQLFHPWLDRFCQGCARHLRGYDRRTRHSDHLVRIGQLAQGTTVPTFRSSASLVGVRSAIATSLVIWSPAIGITAVVNAAADKHRDIGSTATNVHQTHAEVFSSSDNTAVAVPAAAGSDPTLPDHSDARIP